MAARSSSSPTRPKAADSPLPAASPGADSVRTGQDAEQDAYLSGFGMVGAIFGGMPCKRGWYDSAALKSATAEVIAEPIRLPGWDQGRRDAWLVAWGF